MKKNFFVFCFFLFVWFFSFGFISNETILATEQGEDLVSENSPEQVFEKPLLEEGDRSESEEKANGEEETLSEKPECSSDESSSEEAFFSIDSFDALVQAVEKASDNQLIVLSGGEYVFNDTLKIEDKRITFEAESPVCFKRSQDFKGIMITVNANGALHLNGENLIFDGEDRPLYEPCCLSTEGQLEINGATFQNFNSSTGNNHAPIQGIGQNALIILNKGLIQNNDYSGARNGYTSGGFMLRDGATMVMNGGTIQYNESTNYNLGNLVWSDSPGAGAIFIDSGSHFIMNGGEILNNYGFSAVIIGDSYPYSYDRNAESSDKLKKAELATAIFHGGTISGNEGVGGGGISGHGHVDILIPEDSTLTVSRNIAYQGGGIFICDWAVDGIGLTKTCTKMPIEEWSSCFAGKLHMAGGLIENNFAHRCGGGVLISSNNATLVGGKILNNVSYDQGGGVYVTTLPYTAHIENAFISDNDACYNYFPCFPGESGGGLWLCPTGSSEFYHENGVTIARNRADFSGNDFWSAERDNPEENKIQLPKRFSSGIKAQFYEDGSQHRSKDEKKLLQTDENGIPGISSSIEIEDSAFEWSKNHAKLFIMGNRSSKGGGVGSNGKIIFGKKPLSKETYKKIEVVKLWGEGLSPEPVKVQLRGRLDGLDWLIDEGSLAAENDFKWTIEDLPMMINGSNLEDVIYIKEMASEAYHVSIGKFEPTDEANCFQIFIKNEKKEEPFKPDVIQKEERVEKTESSNRRTYSKNSATPVVKHEECSEHNDKPSPIVDSLAVSSEEIVEIPQEPVLEGVIDKEEVVKYGTPLETHSEEAFVKDENKRETNNPKTYVGGIGEKGILLFIAILLFIKMDFIRRKNH